jgi:hypothetical protein
MTRLIEMRRVSFDQYRSGAHEVPGKTVSHAAIQSDGEVRELLEARFPQSF